MSSFSVAGTGIEFVAVEAFRDTGGPLEEWTVDLIVNSAADWGALFSLRSWLVSQRPAPGGNDVYVDIGGGAGEGDLNIDNLDGHHAVMTAVSRDFIEGGGRSHATCTWLITS